MTMTPRPLCTLLALHDTRPKQQSFPNEPSVRPYMHHASASQAPLKL